MGGAIPDAAHTSANPFDSNASLQDNEACMRPSLQMTVPSQEAKAVTNSVTNRLGNPGQQHPA